MNYFTNELNINFELHQKLFLRQAPRLEQARELGAAATMLNFAHVLNVRTMHKNDKGGGGVQKSLAENLARDVLYGYHQVPKAE